MKVTYEDYTYELRIHVPPGWTQDEAAKLGQKLEKSLPTGCFIDLSRFDGEKGQKLGGWAS